MRDGISPEPGPIIKDWIFTSLTAKDVGVAEDKVVDHRHDEVGSVQDFVHLDELCLALFRHFRLLKYVLHGNGTKVVLVSKLPVGNVEAAVPHQARDCLEEDDGHRRIGLVHVVLRELDVCIDDADSA